MYVKEFDSYPHLILWKTPKKKDYIKYFILVKVSAIIIAKEF